MGSAQGKLGSFLEAIISTVASLGIFLSFGLPLELVAGLTVGMLAKNLVLRRLFAILTRRWRI